MAPDVQELTREQVVVSEDLLGEGTSGRVFRGTLRVGGEERQVAVKVMGRSALGGGGAVYAAGTAAAEVANLRDPSVRHHENIVDLLGVSHGLALLGRSSCVSSKIVRT
jgi:hypothetical protein